VSIRTFRCPCPAHRFGGQGLAGSLAVGRRAGACRGGDTTRPIGLFMPTTGCVVSLSLPRSENRARRRGGRGVGTPADTAGLDMHWLRRGMALRDPPPATRRGVHRRPGVADAIPGGMLRRCLLGHAARDRRRVVLTVSPLAAIGGHPHRVGRPRPGCALGRGRLRACQCASNVGLVAAVKVLPATFVGRAGLVVVEL
jgi:hypothetical protein